MIRLTLRRRHQESSEPVGAGEGVRVAPSRLARLARWLDRQVRTVGQVALRRTIAISVEGDAARVLVVRGRDVLAWGMASLEPASPVAEEGAGPTPQRQLEPLRALLDRLGVKHGRLVLDVPLYAPLQRHIRLPKVSRRHLGSVVLSEVLESVPFVHEEVDIAWQSKKEGTAREVSATATPKTAMDNLVRSLREAGVRPVATYSKAVALERVAGVADGIVAYLTRRSLSVVLIADGLPRVVHQADLSQTDAGPRAVAEDVARAVEQMAGYHQGLGGVDGGHPLPVVLTGWCVDKDRLTEELQGLLGREVVPLAAPLRCPKHFAIDEYAINLGLVWADRTRAKSGANVSKRVWSALNLLPERHVPMRIPMGRVAGFVAIMLLAIASANATAKVDEMVKKASGLTAQVHQLQNQERQYRLAAARVAADEQSAKSTEQLIVDLESGLAGLKGEMQGLLRQLETFTGVAGDSILLASIVPMGKDYVVAGAASSYEDAIQYASALRSSGLFSAVALSRVEVSQNLLLGGPGGQAVNFQLRASVTPSSSAGSMALR